jgi:hypothetical protein
MIEPLRLPGVPTTGTDGRRTNIECIRSAVSALLPSSSVLFVDVDHRNGCPCADDGAPDDRCTCDAVDLTLHQLDVRTQ